jgi:hypothetical protein
MYMSRKQKSKVGKPVEGQVLPDPIRKTYFLLAPDAWHSTATYTGDKVTIVHNEQAYIEVIDTGNGYHITDISPLGGTKKYDLDYSVMADIFAALKIFYHNADKINSEYWTIFQGEKL